MTNLNKHQTSSRLKKRTLLNWLTVTLRQVRIKLPATEEATEASSIVEAEVVPVATEPTGGTAEVVYSPSVATSLQPQFRSATAIAPPPSPLENLAAKGGAVGAIVLGTLALFGSFITSYAVLNSMLGLMMGVWGLQSTHKRMAGFGILLCLVAAFFCVVEISSLLPWLWQSDEF